MLLPHFPFGFLVSGQYLNLNKCELENEQLKYANRFITDQMWPEEKEKTPLGHVPVLTETRGDGTKFVLAESNAITRYLARKYGYFGDNEEDTATIDMIYESWIDITLKYLRKVVLATEDNKDENTCLFFEQDFATFVSKHERLLEASESEYYVGKKLSIADIKAWDRLQAFVQIQPDKTAAAVNSKTAPRLYRLWQKVAGEPRIKEWLDDNRRFDRDSE